ncbi:MAG: sulfurtransferase-like selenium metabolism protein YedF [Rikenellaceae bacterium]
MIRVDARGELCPLPLIMTKKAISAACEGDIIEVLSDNDTAKCNLMDYISELGFETQYTFENNVHQIVFSIGKSAEQIKANPIFTQEPSCPVPQKNNYTVVIKSTTMGEGDEKLGAILMRAYINSLQELEKKPKTIILYNEGVKLATKGMDTADSLAELTAKGVEIIVCGTCVDFYDVKAQIKVGKISNMYVISTKMSESDFIAYP